jgi:hypothetical protein
MIQQSNFSRTLWNEAKLGAYYTDPYHCQRIGRLFRFPNETSILEPAIGDATAVQALLGESEKGKENLYVFGVELNVKTYELVKDKISYCLNADFINGVRITNKAFTFCFSNPPYGTYGDNGNERLETKFVEAIYNYMLPGGYLVLVVSYPTMQIESFYRSLLSGFSFEAIYKFDDKEYAKFKQLVFIGKRKFSRGALRSELDEFLNNVKLETIPYLPSLKEDIPAAYEVPESFEQGVEQFTARVFNPENIGGSLKRSSLFTVLENKTFQKPFQSIKLGRPPLPLKKDLLYLCAVSGGGQGLAGCEKERDVHLQRGVVKKVETSSIECSDDNKSYVEVLRTGSSISLNIIDNTGNVIVLK